MRQRDDNTSKKPQILTSLLMPMLLLGLSAACGPGASTPEGQPKTSNVEVTVDYYVGDGIPKCSASLSYQFLPAQGEDLTNPTHCDPELLEEIHSFEDVLPVQGTCKFKRTFTQLCPYKYYLDVSAPPWNVSQCPLDIYVDWQDGGTVRGKHAKVSLEINSSSCDVIYP